ncbi:hypothetical protein ETD85_43350 [Nonomuraea zeae]|uniref:Solute-binding protein family 5 domain-containing protein n=1 Tax=Nonomuraea zeae TaxID=1642303 RepID=A0A5S4FZH7_9ACTN|nr:hypothetical protein ETD85_43350 [Nonomuraea zeae]
MNVLINVFDTLTVRDASDKLTGGLAERWESEDDKTWRFHLRRNVTFHNGEPCDAAAVAYSIQRLIDPATQSPIVELRLVTGAKVIDPHTVDLVTKEPDPILPAELSLFGGVIVPPKHIKEQGVQAFAEHPVGTGPFTFEQWQRDSQITLKANPSYWNGKPAVGRLTFKVMPDPSSSLAALQSGELDIVTGLTPRRRAAARRGPRSQGRHLAGRADVLRLARHRREPAAGQARAAGAEPRARRGRPDQGGAERCGRAHPDAHPAPGVRLRPGDPAHRARPGQGEEPARRGRARRRVLAQAVVLHRRQGRRAGHLGPARRGRRRGRGVAARPGHVQGPPGLRQPQGARRDVLRRQLRLDHGRLQQPAVVRPARQTPEPVEQPRGRRADRQGGAGRSWSATSSRTSSPPWPRSAPSRWPR